MSVTDDLLTNAEHYAETFDKGALPLPPAKHVAVVACMDARLNPYGLLGLAEGDAHVIRNAGGVITADQLRRKPAWAAEAFPDLDDDVRQSVRRILDDAFIPVKESVRGFVYEVETGHLREVK